MSILSKILKDSNTNFVSPMTGHVMAMEDVPDPAFSRKMMGEGCAIDLTEGTVIAPFDAEVTAAFAHTGHAIGLRSLADDTEILLHIGIDTVEMEGEGFDTLVQTGDKVKQGDILVVVDIELLEEAGKCLISPIAFVENNHKVIVHKMDEDVVAGESGLLSYK